MKRGFTIVELLVVIGIISVLAGIVSVAVSGAIKSGRVKRTEAMRVALEQGIAAYYAQEGRWPQTVEAKTSTMGDADTYTFTASETDQIFRDVVGKGFGKSNGTRSMLVDATALFVCRESSIGGAGNGCYARQQSDQPGGKFEQGVGTRKKVFGIDFSRATAKNAPAGEKIPFQQMSFGYQCEEHGEFCRFWIEYNAKADTVKVKKVK